MPMTLDRRPAAARTLLSALLVVAVAAAAAGQAPPPRGACDSLPEAHQLDFWIGTWHVFLPDGTKAGENRIEPILAHCALLENWTSERGVQGKSLNFFDPSSRRWRQLWIDETGTVIDFGRGGLVGNAMRFHGSTTGKDGAVVQQRLTFHPVAVDTVRQVWEQSDDGNTWRVVFDGRYVRHGSDLPP
jgi:hypothetical protein